MPEHHVRIVTYNAHGCVGIDRVLDPARIAGVIVESGADDGRSGSGVRERCRPPSARARPATWFDSIDAMGDPLPA